MRAGTLKRWLVALAVAAAAAGPAAWLAPERVSADVYRSSDMPAAGRAILDTLNAKKVPGGDRILLVNGTKILFRLSRSTDKPDLILDRLERRANEEYYALHVSSSEPGDPLPTPFAQPFRTDGEGWGIVGRVTGAGPLGGPEGVLSSLKAGEGLGPAATGGFAVLALQRPGTGAGSDVWIARFDEDFNPMKLVPRESGDVEGGDLPGIDRFPRSRRVMTISELSGTGNTHSVAYQGKGTAARRASYYARALGEAGFKRNSEKQGEGTAYAHFSGPEADVTVFNYPADPGANEVIDLIQYQPKEHKKR